MATTKKRGAIQFTPITLDEITVMLKRGFRSLKPKLSNRNGELCYDLFITDRVGIRVWTSISASGTQGAGLGEDAIRVQFFNFAKNHPMISGKAPIVKRTQNWRDSLKDRIEDYLELYEEKDSYWESRAQ